MSTSDAFNVTASYDKPAGYKNGDTINIAIAGGDVQTTVTQATIGPLTLHLKALPNNATQDITLPAVPVTITTTTPESVVLAGITDTNPNPLVWTVGADGVTGSAVYPKV